MNKELKDNLYNKDAILESYKFELMSLRKMVYDKKKKKFIRKKILSKLTIRKRKEAFPRKGGKYNELFQDFGKESGVHDNPTKTR